MWAAANRDPDAFGEPDAISIERPHGRSHVAFGWGIHLCVGAPLARAEATVAIETLLDHTSWIELDTDTAALEYIPSLLVRRLRHLPLRVDTR
jgi:cytochrome P450